MPKFLETKLEASAAKAGKTGRDADHYVYGAMNNMGAMRGNKETAKGARMQAKHERDTAAPKKRKAPASSVAQMSSALKGAY